MKKLLTTAVLALTLAATVIPAHARYSSFSYMRPSSPMFRPAYVPTPKPLGTTPKVAKPTPKATPAPTQKVTKPTETTKPTTAADTSVTTSWWNGFTGFLAGWAVFSIFDDEDTTDGQQD